MASTIPTAGQQGPAPTCPNCNDTGHSCEDHPDRAWGGLCCDPYILPAIRPTGYRPCDHGACHCGGAGMPCPTCFGDGEDDRLTRVPMRPVEEGDDTW